MYKCPNCGDDLRFDIAAQKMKCESCDSLFDPETVKEQHAVSEIHMSQETAEEYGINGASADAESVNPEAFGSETADTSQTSTQNGVESEMEVTVFQCPNCGAEIASTSLDAASFCSYCGAPAVFAKRVDRVARPAKILPFQIDRKELKKQYRDFVKKTLYAPKELCDDTYLDNFVGYYMPYWDYNFSVNSNVSVPASRSYRRGDYLYEEKYNLAMDMQGEFRGITYDASSNLSDRITGEIVPFEEKQMRPFTPAYMAGFYAELPDVTADTYLDDAQVDVVEVLQKRFNDAAAKQGLSIEQEEAQKTINRVGLRYSGDQLTMLPVWFLTWRKGDRVSYSVINGATGKMSADIPVDLHAFFRTSALLSVGCFIVLNLFYTFLPSTTLIFSLVMAAVVAWFFAKEVRGIEDRESPVLDQGILYKKAKTNDVKNNAFKKRKGSFRKMFGKLNASSAIISVVVWFFLFSNVLRVLLVVLEMISSGLTRILPILAVVIIGIIWASAMNYRSTLLQQERYYNLPKREMHTYLGFPLLFLGSLLGAAVLLWNPVADFWYYGGSAVVYAACLLAILDMVRYFNLLTSRAVPHYFSKKGADVHA